MHHFFPENYILVSTVVGDINQDGMDDFILLIQDTDKNAFEKVEGLGILNRNRRGIVVLFDKRTHYEVASSNYSCFPPENERGVKSGTLELSIEISKDVSRNNQFYISYLSRVNGEYTSRKYTLRYQKGDVMLIGYDKAVGIGSKALKIESFNFLTAEKEYGVPIGETADGDQIFEMTKPIKIVNNKLLRLRKIADFGNLEF